MDETIRIEYLVKDLCELQKRLHGELHNPESCFYLHYDLARAHLEISKAVEHLKNVPLKKEGGDRGSQWDRHTKL
jgi:hypothetical protein